MHSQCERKWIYHFSFFFFFFWYIEYKQSTRCVYMVPYTIYSNWSFFISLANQIFIYSFCFPQFYILFPLVGRTVASDVIEKCEIEREKKTAWDRYDEREKNVLGISCVVFCVEILVERFYCWTVSISLLPIFNYFLFLLNAWLWFGVTIRLRSARAQENKTRKEKKTWIIWMSWVRLLDFHFTIWEHWRTSFSV